jgi:hypothetical protein
LKESNKNLQEKIDKIEARGKDIVFGKFLKRKNKDKTIIKHNFKTLDELFEWCYKNNKNPVDYDNSWIIPPEWEDFKTLKQIEEEEKLLKRKNKDKTIRKEEKILKRKNKDKTIRKKEKLIKYVTRSI